VRFVVNTKPPLPRRFMMMEHYLSLIREAESELQITMPYFSPLRPFLSEILAAYRRGVKVSILVPERANFENDSNRKTVRYLLEKSNGGIAVYLSPRMVHAKMMYNEKEISLGSSNITKKAFQQLSELNVVLPRNGSAVVQRLLESDAENRRIARRVKDPKEIRYRRFAAWLESLVV
jgi:cardiolipin synthase